MPIRITFGRPRGDPLTLGPFDRMIFRGGTLHAGTAPVAVHVDHSWRVGNDRYSRLDIAGPLTLLLAREGSNRSYGPYTTFSCVDGVAYSEGRVFAFVDSELGDWYCIEDGHHWKSLEVREKV